MGFSKRGDQAQAQEREYNVMKDKVLGELKQYFRPEFLNRIDATIVFHSLTPEQIRRITDLQIDRVRQQLAEQQITIRLTDEAMDVIARKGYDHAFGARPLRRLIQNVIEDPLAEGVLDGRFQAGSSVVVDARDDEIVLEEETQLAAV